MSRIKDTDNTKKLKKRLKKLKRTSIRVGVMGDDELAMIARVNEFGMNIKVSEKMRKYLHSQGLHLKKQTKKIVIPERSFLRTAFDDKKNINKVFKLAKGAIDIDTSLKIILDRVGLSMVGAIQRQIKSGHYKINHPFTTRQKGGKNKPLIDSGRLRQGITHEIKN